MRANGKLVMTLWVLQENVGWFGENAVYSTDESLIKFSEAIIG